MKRLFARAQNYVVLLDSTLPRSQYDYVLPQVSFTAVGYHKHITLIFNPTVRKTLWGWREEADSHSLRPRFGEREVGCLQGPRCGPCSILGPASRVSPGTCLLVPARCLRAFEDETGDEGGGIV